MSYRLDRQIDIQFRPIKMIRRWQFDMQDFPDCGIAKPRELRKRQEQLLGVQQGPEAMQGNVGDLDRGSYKSIPEACIRVSSMMSTSFVITMNRLCVTKDLTLCESNWPDPMRSRSRRRPLSVFQSEVNFVSFACAVRTGAITASASSLDISVEASTKTGWAGSVSAAPVLPASSKNMVGVVMCYWRIYRLTSTGCVVCCSVRWSDELAGGIGIWRKPCAYIIKFHTIANANFSSRASFSKKGQAQGQARHSGGATSLFVGGPRLPFRRFGGVHIRSVGRN